MKKEHKISKRIDASNLWDQILENSSSNVDIPMTRDRLSFALKYRLNECVLNIGSGQGYLEAAASENLTNTKWVASDISIRGLSSIGLNFKNVNLVYTNSLNLPFTDNSFDTVYCMEVLEHLEKSLFEVAVNEMIRVAKKGARIVITVPVYERRSLKKHPVGHMRKFTPSIFVENIKKFDIRILKYRRFYAFKKLYFLKSSLAKLLKIRRPNVIAMVCIKE